MAFQPAIKTLPTKRAENRFSKGVQFRLVPGSASQSPSLRIRISKKAALLANLKPKDKIAIEFDPVTYRVAVCRSDEGATLRPYGTSYNLAIIVTQSRLDDGFLADLKALDIGSDKAFVSPQMGMLVVNLTEDAK